MEPLKEMFNNNFYQNLANHFAKVDNNFDTHKFIKDVTKNISELSLNERMRNTSIVLKNHLPNNYKKSIAILSKVITQLKPGYTSLVFPDFVQLYGHDDYDTSINALKYFTQFGSSEFAIREFLKRDFNKTIKIMESWAEDKNYHVRRLASEGSRPRLPWSFKLDEVIKNPSATKNILEKLNNDSELYVRKSVANHLNDLSKDNPDYMLNVVSSWNKKNSHTAWIIKHACRTLIKKGNPKSLAVFDFEKNTKLNIDNFKFNKSKIKIGETLQITFDIISKKNKTQKLVVDYIVHYKKRGENFTAKVFKLKEISLTPKQTINISKSHRFQDFSTRKHYPGKHVIEIMVNGKTYASQSIQLIN